MVEKDQSVMVILIEYVRNLIDRKKFFRTKFDFDFRLPMLRYCFRSTNDFFSFISLEISVAETLFDVSNFRLERKISR
jgi:hypothetical protein